VSFNHKPAAPEIVPAGQQLLLAATSSGASS
jgi:hypothetical protein